MENNCLVRELTRHQGQEIASPVLLVLKSLDTFCAQDASCQADLAVNGRFPTREGGGERFGDI